MPKLTKMFYITAKGEKKINCYNCIIPKSKVEEAEFNPEQKYIVVAEKGKIILIKDDKK